MIVEIITTGTELLLGEIANENSCWLARFLNEHGYTVAYMTTVGDNPDRMKNAFITALGRADIVITSGGLGSTLGDITKKAGASAMGLSLVHVESEYKRLCAHYEHIGRPMSPQLDRQAWFCKGAFILKNDVGTASGSAVTYNGKTLIHLPGPPFEMKIMAQRYMMPWMEKRFGNQGIIRSVVLSVTGMGEPQVESLLMDLLKKQSNPTIALLARPGFIAVRVTAWGKDGEEALDRMEPVIREIEKRIPEHTTVREQGIHPVLAEELKKRQLVLCAAESCTGGLIGKLMTDYPGSSSYFKGSCVTYWNEAKEHILGVKKETLDKYTAVSAETAREMAEGARRLYGAHLAVSTTGYAGPGQGERGEDPGLVYIAVSGEAGTRVYKEKFLGDRNNVRMGAAEKAMYRVWQYIHLFNIRRQ